MGQTPGIPTPVDQLWATAFTRKIGTSRRRNDGDLVHAFEQSTRAERDGAVSNVTDKINPLPIKPFTDNPETDVRLVLMVRGKYLDLDSRVCGHEFLRRQLSADHPGWSFDVLERPGQVSDHADFYDIRILRQGRPRRYTSKGTKTCRHELPTIEHVKFLPKVPETAGIYLIVITAIVPAK